MCDLPATVSVSGAIFGRRLRCAARNRDAAGGRGACSQRAFRTFPSDADKRRGSNPGSWLAIPDWTSASVGDDIRLDHRSVAVG